MPYEIQQLFFDLDETTVTQIRDKAVALILEAKTLMSWSTPGFNAGKAFVMPPAQMLAEANAALRHLNGTRFIRTYSDFSQQGRQY